MLRKSSPECPPANDSKAVLRERRKSTLPERKAGVPSCRKKQVKGYSYAVVHLDGRDRYLGKWDTPESEAEYNALVARWLAGGRTLPTEPTGAPLSVNEVLEEYEKYAERHYAARRNAGAIVDTIKRAIKPVRELFGMEAAGAFGPKALQLVREHWITTKISRKTINERVGVVKACFRWAAAEELVPGSVWHSLSAVTGLRRGDAAVPEPHKVRPVPDAYVDVVLPHLSPAVRAMVELQRLTGMRPGEVCQMTTGSIDVSGKLWVYRPRHHKTQELHGIEREVFIGPAAQAVLKPWLRTALDDYLFQPREVVALMRKDRYEKRKTPLKYGNRPGTKRGGKRRLPGACYNPGSYRHAIFNGCDKACAAALAKLAKDGKPLPADRPVPRWHPHQLRHTYATRVRREYGIEAARVMLGHQHIGVTEVYAERDRSVATEVAAKIG